jgi:hypothetical protein
LERNDSEETREREPTGVPHVLREKVDVENPRAGVRGMILEKKDY